MSDEDEAVVVPRAVRKAPHNTELGDVVADVKDGSLRREAGGELVDVLLRLLDESSRNTKSGRRSLCSRPRTLSWSSAPPPSRRSVNTVVPNFGFPD